MTVLKTVEVSWPGAELFELEDAAGNDAETEDDEDPATGETTEPEELAGTLPPVGWIVKVLKTVEVSLPGAELFEAPGVTVIVT